MALAGLRPSFGQRGWGHGPHCRVEVQGPSGLGDPVPYINNLFFCLKKLTP